VLIFQKLPEVNNSPIGENSPILVTLVTIYSNSKNRPPLATSCDNFKGFFKKLVVKGKSILSSCVKVKVMHIHMYMVTLKNLKRKHNVTYGNTFGTCFEDTFDAIANTHSSVLNHTSNTY
jgi:hypothetical protein